MGDVYRATDTRLGRDVALKILRGEVSHDADRRARFEREARTVASLNHPNIVALFEVGNADGVEFTASELVDGESLRALIQHGAVPVRRVVELATQLADGMAAAHAAGVVHRDLKPENVMLTRDGRVKILDFGLARVAPPAFGIASGAGSGSSAETVVVSAETMMSPAPVEFLTSPGVVLGTAAYMSPEQARGLETDYRSDQFSFGLMVYELLAGRRPFARGSAIETMAAIVRDEPEPLDPKLPLALRWVVERCLEKEPAQRFDSSRDLYQQLRMLRDHFSDLSVSSVFASGVHSAEETISAPASRRGVTWMQAAAGGLLLLLAGAALAWLVRPAPRHLDKYKFEPFALEAAGTPAWTADGKAAAYTSKIGNSYEVFVRELDSPISRQLTHAGGSNIALGWAADGVHLFFLHQTGPTLSQLESVSRLGGTPSEVLSSTDPWAHAWALSTDGRVVAKFGAGDDKTYHLAISDPAGSPWKDYGPLPQAVPGVFNGPSLAFSPDGKKLLLAYDGLDAKSYIWLLPYPASSGKATREFQKIPHAFATPYFNFMPDGKSLVVATSADTSQPSHLWKMKLGSDDMEQLTTGPTSEFSPKVSPDGKQMLYFQQQVDLDIVSVSLDKGEVSTLISTAVNEDMPQYAANGNGELVYVTERDGPPEIWLRDPDGSTRPLVTPKDVPGGVKWFMSPALSPDGSRVVFSVTPPVGVPRLWMVSVSGGPPVRVTNATGDEGEYPGDWSPDGSRIVFRTYENGQPGLASASADGAASVKKLAVLGGEAMMTLPSWSPAGDRIAYRDTGGWFFMDPDGGHKRQFLPLPAQGYLPNVGFSKDGKTLYGFEVEKMQVSLISVDAATGEKRTIRELPLAEAPAANLIPTVRFSLAPDGKSMTYTRGQYHSTLWLFSGWNQ
jgi:serine/threonine protein kinase/Tol biopolymer transport system component